MMWLYCLSKWFEQYIGRRQAEAIRYRTIDAIDAILMRRKEERILRDYEMQIILDDVMEARRDE